MKTPAVGYLRCSTDKQDTSVKDQREAIEKYAAENGYRIIQFYEDEGISGTSIDGRDAFQDMMRTAQQSNGHPSFQAVLCWDVSRFSRGDNDEAGYFRYLLRQHGIEVVYVTENLRGDETDDLVIGTKQWLSHQEPRDKARNVIRGTLPRIQQGYSSTSHPYGFYREVIDPNGNRVTVLKRGEQIIRKRENRVRLIPGDPNEIQVVRRIFDSYVNRGMGKHIIARMLNQEGIPSPRWPKSKTWSLCAIDYILKNPTYVGHLAFNRTSKAKFFEIRKRGDAYEPARRDRRMAGKNVRRPESEWIVVKNTHEAIVSEELFEKAREVRKARSTRGYYLGRAATAKHLLTGLIRCEQCGRKMQGYRQRQLSGNTLTYYSCPGYEVIPGHKRTPVPGRSLEGYILSRIQERIHGISDQEEVAESLERLFKGKYGDTGKQIEAIEAKLKANSDKVDRHLDAIDPRHKDILNAALDKLSSEREALESERNKILTGPKPVDVQQLAREYAGYAKNFSRVVTMGTLPEQNTLVRHFVAGITINTDRKEATIAFYRYPVTLTTSSPTKLGISAGPGSRSNQYPHLDLQYERIKYKTLQVLEIR